MIRGRFWVPLVAMLVSPLYQCVPTFLHLFPLSRCPHAAQDPQVDAQFTI